MTKSTTNRPLRSPGVIEPNAVYTREEFIARMGLTDDSYRAAVRGGLRIIKKGKRHFVIGRDWIEYLTLDT